MEKNETQLVQMRLQRKTMDNIQKLSELTNTTNRTQLVSSSIQLTQDIFSSIKKGAKVYIENPDGTKELIKIIGV